MRVTGTSASSPCNSNPLAPHGKSAMSAPRWLRTDARPARAVPAFLERRDAGIAAQISRAITPAEEVSWTLADP
jgi:hypothetical protein